MKYKIKIGSNTVFKTAPAIIAIIKNVALPSERTRGLNPVENKKNGIP
ncbi:hypothetical protein [uncultured Granulicatella sp.]|nr:hypothetical protein [uncultured Granulicatella sp.]